MKEPLMAVVLLTIAITAVNSQEPDIKSSHRTYPASSLHPERSAESLTASDNSTNVLTPESSLAVVCQGTPSTLKRNEASDETEEVDGHFRWAKAVEQSLLFLSIQHGYALTQPKTRRELGGNFIKDYLRSVRSLHGWGDGGRFFTNYVAHPMQGSLMGFVQIQNDPGGSRSKFGTSRNYWRSRMKALAWSAAWSSQFELGPISQASIGNIGLHGKQTYVDLVMTPMAGLGLLLAEDALDRHVIGRIERRTRNPYVRIFSRTALNPTRATANLLRFKKPWHRDPGLR